MSNDPQIPVALPSHSGDELAGTPVTEEVSSTDREEGPTRKPLPLPPPTAEEEEEEEDREVGREPKRRRVSCPSAINTCPPGGQNSGAGLSFSLDTTIQPMYSTPKFGSFCLGLDLGVPDIRDPVPSPLLETFALGAEGEEKAVILPEVEHLGAVGKIDGDDRTEEGR